MLGAHDGIIHFTVGQRRGLGVAAGEPLYVVRLDAATRRVVVGPREALRTRPHAAARRQLDRRRHARRRRSATAGCEVFVKVRSTRPPQPAWLRRSASGIEVELVDGEDGVSPGQACVFYDAAERPGAGARRRLHPERGRATAPAAHAHVASAASRLGLQPHGRSRINGGICDAVRFISTTVHVSQLTKWSGDGGRNRQQHGRQGLCALGAGL